MNADGPSMLSLVAAAIYAAVALSCLAAVLVAVWKRQIAYHMIAWGALAAFFVVLVYLRVNNLEEIWRDELRAMMRTGGLYEGRRVVQAPVAVGVLIIIALTARLWIDRRYRAAQGRRNVAVAVAQLGAFVMLGTIALRMVSFSMIDKLLYGPFKLNWVGDIGSAVVVASCAAYYSAVVLAPPRRSKPGDPA